MRGLLWGLLFLVLSAVPSEAQRVVYQKNIFDSTLTRPVVVLPWIAPVGRIEKPEVYEEWWQEAMSCTHLTVSKRLRDKVRFYWVRYPFTFNTPESSRDLYIGYTIAWKNEIYLIWTGLTERKLVEHEMVHFLMYHNGLPPGHPDYLYKTCNLNV